MVARKYTFWSWSRCMMEYTERHWCRSFCRSIESIDCQKPLKGLVAAMLQSKTSKLVAGLQQPASNLLHKSSVFACHQNGSCINQLHGSKHFSTASALYINKHPDVIRGKVLGLHTDHLPSSVKSIFHKSPYDCPHQGLIFPHQVGCKGSLWPDKFEDPLNSRKAIAEIRGTPEFDRKV